ncbi:MAG: site-specific integrase [Nitrospira sp.]|nr:site-specific integrase [Nitrospira sp.]
MGTVFLRGRYYSRVFVPADLRPLIGRVEIRKSLRTVMYRDAKLLSYRWEGRLSHLFTTLRTKGLSMTLEQIKRLVQTYIDEELEGQEAWRMSLKNGGDDDQKDTLDMVLTDRLAETTEHLQRNDYRMVSKKVDDLLQRHKRTVPKTSEAYHRLCRELLKAEQYILKRELDRHDGHYWKEFDQGTTREHPQPETVRLISEALEDYFKHYEHRDKRTNHEKRVIFTRFIDSLGGDRPLQDVVKADCIRFRDQYSRLPKRVPNDLRGKTLGDVLRAVAEAPYQAVTKTTVNLALDDVRHFFQWALKQDYYLGKNPVDGIAYEGTKQNSYDAFTDADLKAIFSSPGFTQERTGKHPERYWLILLLAFTGARREEVAQLRQDDIKTEDGVYYYVNITDDLEQGKRVKNAHSKRRVPIHSRLIDLGFLEFVATRPNRLFRTKEKTKGRDTVGDAVGKWFNRLKAEVGVHGRKPLHSFRHTMVTRLTSAGVPQDMREILVGHASAGVHGAIYTHREEITLTLLREHLEKLRLPI